MITEAALPLLAFQLKPAEATLIFLLKVTWNHLHTERNAALMGENLIQNEKPLAFIYIFKLVLILMYFAAKLKDYFSPCWWESVLAVKTMSALE